MAKIDNRKAKIKKQTNVRANTVNMYTASEAPTQDLLLTDNIRDQGEGGSRSFYYGSDLVGFYGRDMELADLHRFVAEEPKRRLAGVLVTGIGGMGKSKLAFELCNHYRTLGYATGFLSDRDFHLPDNWAPQRPHLVVIDYAADRFDQIKQFVEAYEAARSWAHHVRIVLIERDQELFERRLDEYVRKGGPDIVRALNEDLLAHKPVQLGPLSAANIVDLMRQVIGDKQQFTDEQLLTLFRGTDARQRTLFAVYLAEVLRTEASTIDPQDLTQNVILEKIYGREKRRWRRHIPDEAMWGRYRRLLYLATLMGGCPKTVLQEPAIRPFLPGDDFDSRVYSEIIGAKSGNGTVLPLEPDVLGEYALLELSEDATRESERKVLGLLGAFALSNPGSRASDTLGHMQIDLYADPRTKHFIADCLADLDTMDRFAPGSTKPFKINLLTALGNALGDQGIATDQTRYYHDALKIFMEIIELEPTSAGAWYSKGSALMELGQHGAAFAAFDRATALRPNYAKAWLNKGGMLRILGRHQAALEALDQAIELDPNSAMAWSNKGFVLDQLNQPEAAIAALEQANKVGPNYAPAWSNKGYALAESGRYREAIAAYDQAIKLDPVIAQAWVGKASALIALDQYRDAVQAYDGAIQIDPQRVDAWSDKGTALAKLGQYQDALAAFDQASKLDPDIVEIWINKAIALFTTGQFQKAIMAYDQIIRLSPDDATIYHDKGAMLVALGQYDDALAAIDQAITINPTLFEAWHSKHTILSKLNRHEEAQAILQQAVNLKKAQ